MKIIKMLIVFPLFIGFTCLCSCTVQESSSAGQNSFQLANGRGANFNLFFNTIYPGESLFLYFNNKLVFSAQARQMERQFDKFFNLPFSDTFSIRLVMKYQRNVIQDTTLFGTAQMERYLLRSTAPFPKRINDLDSYSIEQYIDSTKIWGIIPRELATRKLYFDVDTAKYLID
jgi:hypothetical protein